MPSGVPITAPSPPMTSPDRIWLAASWLRLPPMQRNTANSRCRSATSTVSPVMMMNEADRNEIADARTIPIRLERMFLSSSDVFFAVV